MRKFGCDVEKNDALEINGAGFFMLCLQDLSGGLNFVRNPNYKRPLYQRRGIWPTGITDVDDVSTGSAPALSTRNGLART